MLDLLFSNISVVDGTGKPAKIMDVGVKDGKVTFRTDEPTKEIISGEGLTLCPGFIDVHSHDDYCIGKYPATICKIGQGVTTEVAGNCGDSAYPVNPEFLDEMKVFANVTKDYLTMPYQGFANLKEYRAYSETVDMKKNMATLVGHNTLRLSVMGTADRKPTKDEMAQMKEVLRTAMEQGAFGFSTGLVYVPGVYADREEIVELCKVIAPYGGIYATHMRDEADRFLESVEESIDIAEQAGVALQISHFKVRGKKNWGKSAEAFRLIEEAEKHGVKIMVDMYPYDACMSGVSVCIPPEHFSDGMDALLTRLRDPSFRRQVAAEMNDPEKEYDNFYLAAGGFDRILITTCPATPEQEGLTVAEAAERAGKYPMDLFFDTLIANRGLYNGIFFAMDEKEMEEIYRNRRTVVGTDGLCFDVKNNGHPRTWATFVKTLTDLSEAKGLVTFEEAVNKQTARPAEFWGFTGKGKIAEGYDADLVLMDRSQLKDIATYTDSNRNPEGILAVYVAGQCEYKDGAMTDVNAGRILVRNPQ